MFWVLKVRQVVNHLMPLLHSLVDERRSEKWEIIGGIDFHTESETGKVHTVTDL
jgi:hypothetical protein